MIINICGDNDSLTCDQTSIKELMIYYARYIEKTIDLLHYFILLFTSQYMDTFLYHLHYGNRVCLGH